MDRSLTFVANTDPAMGLMAGAAMFAARQDAKRMPAQPRPDDEAGFWTQAGSAFRLQPMMQYVNKVVGHEMMPMMIGSFDVNDFYDVDPEYELTRDKIEGYETWIDHLREANNDYHLASIKNWIDQVRNDSNQLDSFAATLTAEIANPLNLVPIATGIRGANAAKILASGGTGAGRAFGYAAASALPVFGLEEAMRADQQPGMTAGDAVTGALIASLVTGAMVGVGTKIGGSSYVRTIRNNALGSPEAVAARAGYQGHIEKAMADLPKGEARQTALDAAIQKRRKEVDELLGKAEGDVNRVAEIRAMYGEDEIMYKAASNSDTLEEYRGQYMTAIPKLWAAVGQFPYFKVMYGKTAADGTVAMEYIRDSMAKMIMAPGIDTTLQRRPGGATVEMLGGAGGNAVWNRLELEARDFYAEAYKVAPPGYIGQAFGKRVRAVGNAWRRARGRPVNATPNLESFQNRAWTSYITRTPDSNVHVNKLAARYKEEMNKIGAEVKQYEVSYYLQYSRRREQELLKQIDESPKDAALQKELELEDLRASRDAYLNSTKQENYYPWMRALDRFAILEDMDGFIETIEAQYRANPRGNQSPSAIRARARETAYTIRDQLDHPHSMSNDKVRIELVQDRLAKAEAELAEAKAAGETAGPRYSDAEESVKYLGRKLKELETANRRDARGWIPEQLRLGAELDPAKMIDYLVTDLNSPTRDYFIQTKTRIQMSRKFGDPFGETVVENARRFSGLDSPEAKKAVEDALDEFNKMRRWVLGISPIPTDAQALTSRLSDVLTRINIMSYLGSAGISALVDVGVTIGRYGFRPTIKMLARMIGMSDPALRKAIREQAIKAGIVLESLAGQRGANVMGFDESRWATGGRKSMSGWNRLRAGWDAVSDPSHMMVMNGLSPFTDVMQWTAFGLAQDSVLRIVNKIGKGSKLTKTERHIMNSLEMTEAKARQFYDQWIKTGKRIKKGTLRQKELFVEGDPNVRKAGSGTLYFSNVDAWADGDLADEFRAMLWADVKGALLNPVLAERPTATAHAGGRLLLLYKQWAFSSTNRVLARSMQRPDSGAALGGLAMLGMGYLVNQFREPEYIDKDIDQEIMDAIVTSGALGIFMELNDMVEQGSGDQIGIRPALGIEPFTQRDATWGDQLRAGGPISAQWGYLAWALGSGDADAQEKARAMWNFMPYQNAWWWRTASRSWRRALGEGIEEIE